MNTIAIDSNIYKGAESYAKLHNISVTAAIEKAISLFLQKVQPKQKLLETAEFNDALSYVKTLKAKGGKPIPADERCRPWQEDLPGSIPEPMIPFLKHPPLLRSWRSARA